MHPKKGRARWSETQMHLCEMIVRAPVAEMHATAMVSAADSWRSRRCPAAALPCFDLSDLKRPISCKFRSTKVPPSSKGASRMGAASIGQRGKSIQYGGVTAWRLFAWAWCTWWPNMTPGCQFCVAAVASSAEAAVRRYARPSSEKHGRRRTRDEDAQSEH